MMRQSSEPCTRVWGGLIAHLIPDAGDYLPAYPKCLGVQNTTTYI